MSYYKTCPDCGAALDPGEICDCQSDKDSIAFCERMMEAGGFSTDSELIDFTEANMEDISVILATTSKKGSAVWAEKH